MPKLFSNPHVQRTDTFTGLFTDADYQDVEAYFAARPELTPTPLRALPAFASERAMRRRRAADPLSQRQS